MTKYSVQFPNSQDWIKMAGETPVEAAENALRLASDHHPGQVYQIRGTNTYTTRRHISPRVVRVRAD